MKADAIYETVTDALVRAIETEGDLGVWRAPWHGLHSGMPINASTKKAYQGGNVIALWITALERNYYTQVWATYKQWEQLGAQVRKGEKGTFLIKWLALDPKRDESGEIVRKRAFVPRGFTVFNAAQVDGYETTTSAPVVGVEHADEFFDRLGATIRLGDPAYHPLTDVITLPPLADFNTPEDFYATKGHEHVHWTGAESRLNRDGIAKFDRFGSEQYAFEELVAEIGAAFVCAHLGISAEPRKDHAQYLKNWLKTLRNDPKALYRAATLAQKAVDFLIGDTADQERELVEVGV